MNITLWHILCEKKRKYRLINYGVIVEQTAWCSLDFYFEKGVTFSGIRVRASVVWFAD